VAVDLAIVCATHRNLREMMTLGLFRDDLYWRLNGLVVRLPPLRQRTDLPVIVQRLLRALQEEAGGGPAAVAPQTMALFSRHAWPGNLRQLSSVLRTAMLMARGEPAILPSHLPEDFLDDQEADAGAAPLTGNAPASLREMERAALRQAMQTHGGNVSAVARSLGLSRNAIYRRLRQP
jgi:transcriptional regulator of acetoin/glycerol metabolism